MNISQFIAKKFSEKGICDVFSIVGGHSLYLNYSFSEFKGLNVTYFHHEQSASMAADAYYRLKLKPAIVNVSAGPAALNTLNGVYGSFVDSIPVIYISGQPKSSQQVSYFGLPLRQYGDQEYDGIASLVKSITKYSVSLTHSSNINYEIEKAYSFAVGGRPGPVWIDIPMDIQSKTFEEIELSQTLLNSIQDHTFSSTEIATQNQIDLTLEKLLISKRPIIYAGPQIRPSLAIDSFKNLVKILKIPVVTSWNAHDVIETDSKYFVGRPGLRAERSGNWSVYASDFLLILGEHLTTRQIGYDREKFAPNAFKVMVDHDYNELHKPKLKIDLVINANLSNFMDRLASSAKDKIFNFNSCWQEKTKKVWREYKPQRADYDFVKYINPYHFLMDLFEYLPGQESIIIGNGISVVGAFQVAIIKDKQQMFQNYGCASMGYDLPAVVGTSLASDSKVICLTGDGSIQLNIQELETIKRLGKDVSIFVINNGGYDSIRQSQEMAFNSRYHGIDENSGLTFPDLEKISSAYGFKYFKIDNNKHSKEVIDKAYKSKLSICEIFVDKGQNFEPKVATLKNEDGSITSGQLINMKPFMNKKEIDKIISDLVSEK